MKNLRRTAAETRYLRFVAWRRRVVPQGVTLMILAVLVGAIAGVAAWFLKWSISAMCSFFLSFETPGHPNWYILVLPFIGFMLVVAYQKWVVHGSLEHGTTFIQKAISERHFQIRTGMCYQPIIASVMTLGFGGSAGAEGPVATVGSALGSNLGRMFGIAPPMVRTLIGCGAGAGISGIFKAPIGGALFTLEVMKMKMTTLTVLALIMSSITGALTCYMLTGFSFDVKFLPTSFFDPRYLGWVCLLGVFCGLYSIYYNWMVGILHRFFSRISNVWLRGLTGAAILGVCLFLFPAMYGEGYGVVTKFVNGDTLTFLQGGLFEDDGLSAWAFILFGLAVLVLKVFATISTNSAGGVAGDFAPTIFAGAFCGVVFAWLLNYLFHAEVSVALFALFGTAGAFAGIIHAPLMAIFLVSEMVGNGYGFFLPLTVTATFSYLTVKLITPLSRYMAANHDDLAALFHKIK